MLLLQHNHVRRVRSPISKRKYRQHLPRYAPRPTQREILKPADRRRAK